MLDRNTWNHLNVYKQMIFSSFKNVIYTICVDKSYIFYYLCSSNNGASPSYCLVSYPRHSIVGRRSYPLQRCILCILQPQRTKLFKQVHFILSCYINGSRANVFKFPFILNIITNGCLIIDGTLTGIRTQSGSTR